MQRWHGGLRDAGRAMLVVGVAVAASSASGGLIHSGSGLIESVSGGLVGIAFPAGWIAHRRRHPVGLPIRPVARVIGGILGILVAVVLRGPVMLVLLTLDYGSSGALSVAVRLVGAGALFWLGRWVAQRRLSQLAPEVRA